MSFMEFFICDSFHTPILGPYLNWDKVINVCEMLQALKLYDARELWVFRCELADGKYKYLSGGGCRVDEIIDCHNEAVKLTGKEDKQWHELVEAVKQSVR